jgi:hypothetical protein
MATIAKYTITTLNDRDKISHHHYPALPNSSTINDRRTLLDFKLATIGGYPKGKVLSVLDKCLAQQKIEEAIYWSFQLLCSGIVNSLWDKLVFFIAKNTNIYNPLISEWLYQKTLVWNNITSNDLYKKNNVLNLRNHPTIRNMITEIIVLASLSKPRKLETLPKIEKSDFIITNFKSKLESSDMSLTHSIFKDEDPKEVRIASTEIAHHLLGGNIVRALYWLNWILTWEALNIKKYSKFDCNMRTGGFFNSNSIIPVKCNRNVIWLIWTIIENIKHKKTTGSSNLEVVMRSLWELFILNYTSGSRNRRLVFIIWAMSYLCNPIDWSVPTITTSNNTVLFQALLKNDKIMCKITGSTIKAETNPINSIVENNYKKPDIINNDVLTDTKYNKNKLDSVSSNKGNSKKGVLSVESQKKLDEFSKLDRFMETTIFT